jgi:glucose-6-phosphate dehydrogenase assembly protein OpcA
MDSPVAVEQPTRVALGNVESELRRQFIALHGATGVPVIQARMSNLVIFCQTQERARALQDEISAIVATHPARVLMLIGEPAPGNDARAAVMVRMHKMGREQVCSEEVTLWARGQSVEHLPFAVRTLLIGDLPTNLWWASPQPPPLAGPLLYDLTERAQQLVYDSHRWSEPHKGVSATFSWLEQFERRPDQGRWRVASDLNWRRLKYWRRVLGQALDPAAAPGALESISEVLIEHGPHAVTQAWLIVSWLAARLGWHVENARTQQGVEMSWQVTGPHGCLGVRVHRLHDGPSELRRVRIACQVTGKPGAMNVVIEEEKRLAVFLEGTPAAARTVTLQQHSLADLLARQLSDREPDPVFRETMAVAGIFARSVLG